MSELYEVMMRSKVDGRWLWRAGVTLRTVALLREAGWTVTVVEVPRYDEQD